LAPIFSGATKFIKDVGGEEETAKTRKCFIDWWNLHFLHQKQLTGKIMDGDFYAEQVGI
jgi:hypothetical protein